MRVVSLIGSPTTDEENFIVWLQFSGEQEQHTELGVHVQAKLNSRMIAELKEMLRKRQQQVKGTKTDLIERLTPLLLREATIADYITNLTCASAHFPLASPTIGKYHAS